MSADKKILFAVLICVLVIPWPDKAFTQDKLGEIVSGSIYDRIRLRTTGGETDLDNETRFTLNIGDMTKQKVTGHMQLGAIVDLNGNQSNSFYDIYNTFGSAAVGRIYYAYLDVNKIVPLDNFRFGRQHNYDFESFYFDGASFDLTSFYGFKLSAYAGKPVHLYENQLGWGEGDFLIGSALTWTPVDKMRIRFDGVHLRDEAAGFRVTEGKREDNLLGAAVWLDPLKNWDVYGRFTSFSDQTRDLTVATAVRSREADLRVKTSVYRLLQPYDVRVPELDLYSIAGTYQRYTEFMFDINKGFGKQVRANGGFSLRMLDTPQSVSAFNHGYERGYLTVNTSDMPIKGLSLSATGDYYHGTDSTLKNNHFGSSFYASQSLFKKRLVATAGTAYYLYRFNFATGDESHDVQTVYAKLETKITKKIKVKTDYEYEHNNFNSYHTFNLGMLWDF